MEFCRTAVVRLLICGSLVFGSFEAAHAASYYVDAAGGSDSNNGTSSSSAWRSLARVNSATFQPGDVINFRRGGTWTGTLEVRSSGTSTSPITYRAYGTGAAPHISTSRSVMYGDSVTITGDWNIVQDFLLSGAHEAGVQISRGADHNIVRNNEMTNAGTGVSTIGQHNLITQNYAHDLTMIVNNTTNPTDDYGAVCFFFYAGDNELSYNRGINCRAPSHDFEWDGGFVEVFGQGDNLNIHHNYAENTVGFFELGASSSGSARNITVAYNVMFNTATGVGINTGVITVTNFRFEHNTFVLTNPDGFGWRVFWGSDNSGLVVRNNIFYSNIQIANNGNFTRANNLYYMVNMVDGSGVGYALGSGERTGNPLFVGLATGNLLLQAASPAINAGLNLGYQRDYEDNPVPIGSAPDLGAHEFGAVAGPRAPANLRISAQ